MREIRAKRREDSISLRFCLRFCTYVLDATINYTEGSSVLGNQSEFEVESNLVCDMEVSGRTTETVGYITDLLGELKTIATLSGLSHLSDDIQSVLAKHRIEVFQS